MLCRSALQRKNCLEAMLPMLIALVPGTINACPVFYRVQCSNALFATNIIPVKPSSLELYTCSLAQAQRSCLVDCRHVARMECMADSANMAHFQESARFVRCLKGADHRGACLHASPSKGRHRQCCLVSQPQVLRPPRQHAHFRLHALTMHGRPPPAALHVANLFCG